MDFEDIGTAQHVPHGTVADLKMASGEVVRAAWCERGSQVTAWWPLSGRRKRPIGLYEPEQWRRVDGVNSIPTTRRR